MNERNQHQHIWNTCTIGRRITVMIQSFSNPFTSKSPSDWFPAPGTVPMHRFSSVAPQLMSVLCLHMAFLKLPPLLISANYIWLVTLMKNSPMILASFTTVLHLFLYLSPFLLFLFSLTFNLRTDTVIRKLQRNTPVSPKPLFPDSSSMQIPMQICHYTCTIKVKVIARRIAWLLVTAIQCSELCKRNTNKNATTSLTQMFLHIVCWNYCVENIAMMRMPWQKTQSERQSLSLRIIIMSWSK